MILHVFNPEHDIALAHGSSCFTAPRAGRQLRDDLGWIPLLWAGKTDLVLSGSTPPPFADRRLLAPTDLRHHTITEVRPWGWDAAIVGQMARWGIPRQLMPDDDTLDAIRRLSSRATAAGLLQNIRTADFTVGRATAAHSMDELRRLIGPHQPADPDAIPQTHILKAPWSSSGRGLRTVGSTLTEPQASWAKNIIRQQQAIMVEPFYNKTIDFGMEFWATRDGISYRGLSIFDTRHGAYTGNILASEDEKAAMLATRIPTTWLTTVRHAVIQGLTGLIRNIYVGPLGVDMMVVSTPGGLKLHPMVEINLRRTMGHVAIDLARQRPHARGRMMIACRDGHYRMNILDDKS